MVKKQKQQEQKLYCPFIEEECIEAGCRLYHKEFDRCLIDLVAFNTYALAAEMKKYNQSRK